MMKKLRRRATLAFAAGCLGGLANSLAVWAFGALGITAALGVAMAPALTPPWLYPRIVWGGIWGFLFLFASPRLSLMAQGAIFSLGPTVVQLLVVFPYKAGKGLLGLDLGLLTPLFVVVFNLVWGLAAAAWIRSVGRSSGGLD